MAVRASDFGSGALAQAVVIGFVELLQHIVAHPYRRILGRFTPADAVRQSRHNDIVIGREEKGDRRPIPLILVDDPMHGRREEIIGPMRHRIPDIHHEGAR